MSHENEKNPDDLEQGFTDLVAEVFDAPPPEPVLTELRRMWFAGAMFASVAIYQSGPLALSKAGELIDECAKFGEGCESGTN